MGFVCYQPRYRKCTVTQGRKRWTEHLLLGRYLLIEWLFDFVAAYYAITSAKGVGSLLMCDEKPLVAREGEVAKLRGSEVKGCVPVLARKNRFTKGDKVFAIKGPFVDHCGQYVEGRENSDVVLFELFGQLTPVELPHGSLIVA